MSMEILGEFVARLHYANWTTIVGLFCSLGLLIVLPCAVVVLLIIQWRLGQLGKVLGSNKKNSEG